MNSWRSWLCWHLWYDGRKGQASRFKPIRLMAPNTLQHGYQGSVQYIAKNGSATWTMLTFSKITFEILKDNEMCLSDCIERLPAVSLQSCFRTQFYSVELYIVSLTCFCCFVLFFFSVKSYTLGSRRYFLTVYFTLGTLRTDVLSQGKKTKNIYPKCLSRFRTNCTSFLERGWTNEYELP